MKTSLALNAFLAIAVLTLAFINHEKTKNHRSVLGAKDSLIETYRQANGHLRDSYLETLSVMNNLMHEEKRTKSEMKTLRQELDRIIGEVKP